MQNLSRLVFVSVSIALGACGGTDEGQGLGRKGYEIKEAMEVQDAAPAPDLCNEKGGSQITIRALAPEGVSQENLGRPVDQHFEPIAGEAGQSLFPRGEHRTTPINSMEVEFNTIESSRQRDANVGVTIYGVSLGGDRGKGSAERFATYRTSQVREVREIDDASYLRPPPPTAVYYLSRIFYGAQYEMFMRGSSQSMSRGIKAGFNWGIFGAKAGVSEVQSNSQVEIQVRGRGLTPTGGEAIFVTKPEDISKFYKADPNAPAVPIYVEYRSIPRVCVPPDEQINWIEPQRVRFTIDKIDVYSKGGDCWYVDARCSLNDKRLDFENRQFWKDAQISDSCKSDVPGPGGGRDYCSYNVYGAAWQTGTTPADILSCGIEGQANSNGKKIPYTSFTYRVKEDNGVVKGTFGDALNGVEYRVHYTLEFTKLGK